MRYGIAAVLALLIIALAACVHQSRKSKRSMAPSVAMMIGALILPVTGNLVIILSSNKLLSTLGYFTYFLGMNVVMFALVRFTFKYCQLPAPREWLRRVIHGLLIMDAVQLLCNPILHHAFDLEAVEVAGAPYYKLIPYLGQTVHRVVCYSIFFASIVIFCWKMISAPRLYFERYSVIFFSMAAVGIWETFYILNDNARRFTYARVADLLRALKTPSCPVLVYHYKSQHKLHPDAPF